MNRVSTVCEMKQRIPFSIRIFVGPGPLPKLQRYSFNQANTDENKFIHSLISKCIKQPLKRLQYQSSNRILVFMQNQKSGKELRTSEGNHFADTAMEIRFSIEIGNFLGFIKRIQEMNTGYLKPFLGEFCVKIAEKLVLFYLK